MTWKRYPYYWPFVRGIYWLLMDSLPKGQWCAALMFPFNDSQQTTEQTICRWIEMSWCSFDVTVIDDSMLSWKMEFIVYIYSPLIVIQTNRDTTISLIKEHWILNPWYGCTILDASKNYLEYPRLFTVNVNVSASCLLHIVTAIACVTAHRYRFKYTRAFQSITIYG